MGFLDLFRKRSLNPLKKRKNEGGVCACKEQRIKLKKEQYSYERAPLKENKHTSFDIMFCEKCDGLVCFPHGNFELYMKEGVEPYLSEFRKRFNITKI